VEGYVELAKAVNRREPDGFPQIHRHFQISRLSLPNTSVTYNMPVTIKVTHTPSATTRKLLVEPPSTYESLVQLVLSRFQLQGPAELVYTDEDGDLITLVSLNVPPGGVEEQFADSELFHLHFAVFG
jgi:hypothetical protein